MDTENSNSFVFVGVFVCAVFVHAWNSFKSYKPQKMQMTKHKQRDEN